jgi:hypothetical protein
MGDGLRPITHREPIGKGGRRRTPRSRWAFIPFFLWLGGFGALAFGSRAHPVENGIAAIIGVALIASGAIACILRRGAP